MTRSESNLKEGGVRPIGMDQAWGWLACLSLVLLMIGLMNGNAAASDPAPQVDADDEVNPAIEAEPNADSVPLGGNDEADVDARKAVPIEEMELAPLRKAAQAGDPSAQRELAKRFENGVGVKQNNQRAVEWYRKAVEQGHLDSMSDLGNLLVRIGGRLNKEEAYQLYRAAAEEGNLRGIQNMGFSYSLGRGVPRDLEKARTYFETGVEKGFPLSFSALADLYFMGQGVERDRARAVALYRKGVELGCSRSMVNLGLVYQNSGFRPIAGTGLRPNIHESIKLFKQAGELGCDYAINNLALILFHGQGGAPRDFDEGIRLFHKAAEMGNNLAMSNLHGLYYQHQHGHHDMAEAFKWLRKAAEAGHVECQYGMGRAYGVNHQRWGVSRNPREMFKWYEKAARNGHAHAQVEMGHSFCAGRGVQKDESRAAYWNMMATRQNHMIGMYNLGLYYEDGRGGVSRDPEEALRLFRASAARGYSGAREKLKRLGVD